ncbi:transglutaminase N-terminal domain-containing protein [Acetobacter papayae]|uniref:transglutaminase N-terminal domain-containing protein n=1 Tax=Acetobacter papayae TaxID=1076592 RepID=UPI0034E23E8C
MSSQITLVHRTCYRYDRPVTMGPQTVRLRPMKDCRTPVLSYTLKVEPAGGYSAGGRITTATKQPVSTSKKK